MPDLCKVHNGKIALFQKQQSKMIYCRWSNPDNKRQRIERSTGTTDMAEATAKAIELYTEAIILKKHNVITQVSFERVAGEVIKKLQAEVDAGNASTNTASKIRILKKMERYFGKRDIGQMTEEAISDWFTWREKELGQQLAKGTINNDNIVLRLVFTYAKGKRWISATEIPELSIKNKGRKSQKRPGFTVQEVEQVLDFLDRWHQSTSHSLTSYKRQLLACYCHFLANTGVRPGNEPLSLTWSGVQDWRSPEGKLFKLFWLQKGKVGKRDVIASKTIDTVLLRIAKLTRRTQADDLVFAMHDGSAVKDLPHMFEQALTECGLRFNPNNEPRVLYSFRHAYATKQVLGGVPLAAIAKNMGTSIKMLDDFYSDLTARMAAEQLAPGEQEFAEAYSSRALERELKGKDTGMFNMLAFSVEQRPTQPSKPFGKDFKPTQHGHNSAATFTMNDNRPTVRTK